MAGGVNARLMSFRMSTQLKRWKSYFELSIFLFLAALTGAIYTHYYRDIPKDPAPCEIPTTCRSHYTKRATEVGPEPFELHCIRPCFDDDSRQCKLMSRGKVKNIDQMVVSKTMMGALDTILKRRS